MIVIAAKDKDFSQELATQLARGLGVACRVADVAANDGQDRLWIGEPPQAAEYLLPPLPLRLAALIEDIRRRLSDAPPQEMPLPHGVVLSAAHRALRRAGAECSLTEKETALMEVLAQAHPEGVDRQALLKQVWGIEAELNTHTLETHIYRLRAKCKELCGEELIEAAGGGYRLA